jgi:hypothetical protein
MNTTVEDLEALLVIERSHTERLLRERDEARHLCAMASTAFSLSNQCSEVEIARLREENERLRKDLHDMVEWMPLEQYRRLVAARGRPIFSV